MDAILQSFGLVLASEMGDKTQLLALVLALRFKMPWVVMSGILCATLLNHGIASALGGWIAAQVPEESLRLSLAVLFALFAIWILVPDKLDEDETQPPQARASAFITTTVLFFIAEMGDKTQLATIALGAKFQAPIAVTVGTTLGMLGADGLAVVFGERLTSIVPMKLIRVISAVLFLVFGVAVYFSWI